MGRYLATLNSKEIKQRAEDLIGVRKSSRSNNEYYVPDNYTNRLVLGFPLSEDRKPRELTVTDRLVDFQIEDVRRMVNSSSFLNANRMGTGKTVETIMALRNLNAKSVLIVCPKPIVGQWVAQVAEWWPEMADSVKEYTFGMDIEFDTIYVANYEKLISKRVTLLDGSIIWDALVLDEAHYIKNRTALRTKACKQIPAIRRYALTGTPILKSPDDLYSILDFLDPRYAGGSYWNFVNYYCHVVDGFFGTEIQGLTKNPLRIERLNKIMEAVSCRRTNSHIANGKRQIHIKLDMDSKQANLYRKIKKLVLEELPQELTIPNGAVLLLRLIQTTSAPAILDDKNSKSVGVKFEWILETIQNNRDEKFVIFSQFSKVVESLAQFLRSKGIGCATYTGDMSTEERMAEKQRFISSPDCSVIIGTIGSMGTGVDGLQKVSRSCVFIDRSYSPEINAQCEDRLHRMGQQNEVLCYYLECTKTVDNKVDKINYKRAEDIRRALNDD